MPFSVMQQAYLKNATCRWNIKTGATRSGKTYLDYAFTIPKRIRACKGDGLIFILGNTQATIERNVLSPMRSIWGAEMVGNITNAGKVNLFGHKCYAIGADKKNRVSMLQGAGVEYCYGDEVTTWSEDVFQMLKSRMDKPNSAFDGTCNPDTPTHWFKTFLDSDADIFQQAYKIDDNPFLTPSFVTNLKNEYRGTVFYDRFILGKWVAAEGIIYRRFADDVEAFVVDKAPHIAFSTIGVDFGGNGSAHAFNCTGYLPRLQGVITLDEYHSKEPLDANDLAADLVTFVKRQMTAGYNVSELRMDSEATVLIRTCRNALIKAGISVPVLNAIKGAIMGRIHFYNLLFGAGRYKIMRNCTHTIDAFANALYDSKSLEDKRLDNGSTNIDSLDAQEYSTEPHQKKMIDVLMLGGGTVEPTAVHRTGGLSVGGRGIL